MGTWDVKTNPKCLITHLHNIEKKENETNCAWVQSQIPVREKKSFYPPEEKREVSIHQKSHTIFQNVLLYFAYVVHK